MKDSEDYTRENVSGVKINNTILFIFCAGLVIGIVIGILI